MPEDFYFPEDLASYFRRRRVFDPLNVSPPGVELPDVATEQSTDERFPSLTEYRRYLQTAPKMEEFQPGKLRRVLAVLAGGLAGAGEGPGVGYEVGRRAVMGPFLERQKAFELGVAPRKEAAEVELLMEKARAAEPLQAARISELGARAEKERAEARTFGGRPTTLAEAMALRGAGVRPQAPPTPRVEFPGPGRRGMIVRPGEPGQGPEVQQFGEALPEKAERPIRPLIITNRKSGKSFRYDEKTDSLIPIEGDIGRDVEAGGRISSEDWANDIEAGNALIAHVPKDQRGEVSNILTARGASHIAKPLSSMARRSIADIDSVEDRAAYALNDLEAKGISKIEQRGYFLPSRAKYSLGMEKLHGDLIASLEQLSVSAAMPYMRGSRSYLWVAQIQKHVPKVWIDAPAMIAIKLRNVQRISKSMKRGIQIAESADPFADPTKVTFQGRKVPWFANKDGKEYVFDLDQKGYVELEPEK